MLGLIAPRRCMGCDDIIEDQDPAYCAADFDLLQKERESEVSVALDRAKDLEAKVLALDMALDMALCDAGRLLGIVQLIEWSGSDLRLECPLCHGTKERGHVAECLLLGAVKR